MKKALSLASAILLGLAAGAQNPYLPLWEHLPDGEPRVFEDPDNPGHQRVYIIGSHDVRFKDYCGPDIHAWSAPVEDLSAWRDEGAIFTYNVDDQWDVMFAPDLVEINQKDGKKVYYLYPHSRGWGREAMVCKGDRPDGPFIPLNLTEDGRRTLEGSTFGFDPSVFVEPVTDPDDPDYEIGFRAYGYWGFQRSSAAQIDQNTMWSVRPGTEMVPFFIPASFRYGMVHPIPDVKYAVYDGQDLGDFNFFEASSIRQVGNKYVWVFSGHSGPDYGLESSNATLRYAFSDSPMGPWKSGGVLVDARGPVLKEDGTMGVSYSGHNTHGSLQYVNGQWYVFYHRAPRGFGFARQPMVAPVSISYDEAPVAEGGAVRITAYDPYVKGGSFTVKDVNGNEYKGAEVTSEGFAIYGLEPYKYYCAGYACFMSNTQTQSDSWDVWNPAMDIKDMRDGEILGYKYFGFGGLKKAKAGHNAFQGTKRIYHSSFNLFLTPRTDKAFGMEVWLDSPYADAGGKLLCTIEVPAGSAATPTKFCEYMGKKVDKLKGKHAIYLVARGEDALCDVHGLGFSRDGEDMQMPFCPTVSISVNGQEIELPEIPTRSTNANGYISQDIYEVPAAITPECTVEAKADGPVDIKISTAENVATVLCTWNEKTKTYILQ